MAMRLVLFCLYIFKTTFICLYVGVQFKTRIDLNNIKILNILFLIFNF